MEDLNSVNKRAHKITLLNRRTCNLTGVNDVLSFDVNEIILETDQGMLMIKGSELHVNRLTLDKGEVDVEGKIDSLPILSRQDPWQRANLFFPGCLSKSWSARILQRR